MSAGRTVGAIAAIVVLLVVGILIGSAATSGGTQNQPAAPQPVVQQIIVTATPFPTSPGVTRPGSTNTPVPVATTALIPQPTAAPPAMDVLNTVAHDFPGTPLALGTRVTSITGKGLIDYYRVSLTAGQTVQIQIDQLIVVVFYPPGSHGGDGDILCTGSACNNGRYTAKTLVPRTGVYIVKIGDGAGDAMRYTLTVTAA